MPTSGERGKMPKESWAQCPRCGARFKTWDRWFGSTLWMRGYDGREPAMEFKYCPNCGEKLEGKEDER